jgi:CDP-diacylglycerol---glycerol-3-phosphate 3-phosphatidyltransferase
MLNLRPAVGKVAVPLGRGLLRLGVTPDMVTVTGTVVTVAASAGLLATGRFVLGTIIVTLAVLSDALDGTMARLRGGDSVWGAFLDSTMDRIADGAVFGAVAFWYSRSDGGDNLALEAVALFCLVTGAVTSYIKARAQSVGLTCDVGLVERTERLILILAGTALTGLGLKPALPVLLVVLAVGSAITVGQRLAEVHRQATVPAP